MLSEREQRALTELECDLRSSDPRWTASMTRRSRSAIRLGLAIGLLVAGLLVLLGGEIVAWSTLLPGVLIGVAGFVLMLGAAWEVSFGRSSLMAMIRSARHGRRVH